MIELTPPSPMYKKISKEFGNTEFAWELNTILEKVIWVLGSKYDSRNNDMILVKQYYCHYHTEYISFSRGPAISLEALINNKIPRPETIIRLRRKVNQMGFLYPTEEKVARHRQFNMNKWREALGYEHSDQGRLAI